MRLDRRRLEQVIDEDRCPRERGAALIMVLIFGIAAMSMVILLLTLSDQGLKSEADFHSQKELQAVLKVGIAQSLYEINLYRFRNERDDPLTANDYDPDDDGIGALVGQEVDGNYLGFPVIVTDPESGLQREIGRYRTTLRHDAGSDQVVLTVVAAYPGFDVDPDANPRDDPRVRQLRTAATEVVIKPERFRWPFPDNPFVMVGSPGNIAAPPAVGKHPTASHMTAIDPSLELPAGNISDPDLHAAIVAAIVDGDWTGADPNNILPSASGADTVTNDAAGTLSQAALEAIYDGVDARVAAIKLGAYTSLTTGSGNVGDGTFVVSGNLSVTGNLVGKGTLVIEGGLSMQGGGKIEWEGDIIVWGESASLKTQGGGQGNGLHLTGDLFVEASSAGTFSLGNGSKSTVDGGVYLLSKDNPVKADFASGGDLEVNGILALLGNGIDFEVKTGSDLEVNGSFAVGITGGGDLDQFRFRQGSRTNFNFNRTNYENALATVNAFIDGLLQPPPTAMETTSYLEGLYGFPMRLNDPGLGRKQLNDINGATGRPGWQDEWSN